jgi:hypothetical protein
MAQKIVLYSTNSWLAYQINQRFYDEEHYVYCSPVFSARSLAPRDLSNPVTTLPSDIYRRYREEVQSGDRHGPTISGNRIGIIRGANVKAADGIISVAGRTQIHAIVKASETRDFRPLVYVIPYASLVVDVSEVSIPERAHPLSEEYLIRRLPRSQFDVLEFE